jgi:hypothetical protein
MQACFQRSSGGSVTCDCETNGRDAFNSACDTIPGKVCIR